MLSTVCCNWDARSPSASPKTRPGWHRSIHPSDRCNTIPYGACLLGSINLARLIRDPFTPNARLDEVELSELVSVAIRIMDNTIDVSGFPLEAQRQEAIAKRRIGLGMTGLADALMMVGLRYGTHEAAGCATEWARQIERAAYTTSAHLAAEKGPFPLYDRDAYLAGETVRGLDAKVRSLIAEHGIRNALLTSVAPTGTISLVADNVSSGIEPVFALAYTRKVLQPDGSRIEEEVSDYALRTAPVPRAVRRRAAPRSLRHRPGPDPGRTRSRAGRRAGARRQRHQQDRQRPREHRLRGLPRGVSRRRPQRLQGMHDLPAECDHWLGAGGEARLGAGCRRTARRRGHCGPDGPFGQTEARGNQSVAIATSRLCECRSPLVELDARLSQSPSLARSFWGRVAGLRRLWSSGIGWRSAAGHCATKLGNPMPLTIARRTTLVSLVGLMAQSARMEAVAADAANPDGALVVAEDVPPQTFDPTQSSQIRTWYAWQLVYEGLVIADLQGNIKPVLATHWTVSPDKLSYEFDLREGAAFSDASPVTADDVVFSFERLASGGLPYAKDRFRSVKAIRQINDRRVRFELIEPDAGFLLNLGSPFLVGSAVLSRKWAEEHNPKTEMMGTGPFRMVAYAPNRELQLVRNDGYWNKAAAARVAKLTIRYMPEQSAQIAGLISGQGS